MIKKIGLAAAIIGTLRDENVRRRMGEAGKQFIAANRGDRQPGQQ